MSNTCGVFLDDKLSCACGFDAINLAREYLFRDVNEIVKRDVKKVGVDVPLPFRR